jgi:hypothetical protein
MLKKWLVPAAVALIVICAGVWYFLVYRTETPPPAVVTAPPPPPPPAPTEPATLHPIPEADGQGKDLGPVPPLNDSDAAMLTALASVAGPSVVKHYLIPENIVRRLVVTIDGLARPKLAPQKLPLEPVPGVLLVDGDELHSTLDAHNYARYRPLVAAVRDLDMQRVANVYFHFYPLFQDAYQSLGLPNAYFNDRLVEVIDELEKTPEPTAPVDLVRPSVMYQFADPALEGLPAGEKILIRMGPENASVIKAKLAELRAIVTAGPLKH